MAKSEFARKIQIRNFLVVWASQTTAAILIFTFPALSPILVTKYALTTPQIGELTGIMYVGISGVSIFISVLSDQLGVKKILIVGHLIEAVAIISASFAHSFAGFAASIFCVGVGYSAITPVTSKAIMSWFSKENRSAVMGLKQTGTTVGGSIAGAVLPIVGVTFGGPAAFITAGGFVLSGVLFVLFYKDSSQKTFSSLAVTLDFLKKGISASLRGNDLISLGAVGFFYAAVQSIVVSYITLFALDVLGFGPVVSGLFLSVVNIAGTLGRPVYGSLSDRLFKGNRIKDMFLISATSFVMLLLLSLLHRGGPLWEIIPVVALLGFAALGWNGVFLTLGGEYSDPGLEAVGTSLAFSIAMTGQIVGAPVFGLIVQSTGSYATGWRVFAIALILAASAFAVARRNRDPGKAISAQTP